MMRKCLAVVAVGLALTATTAVSRGREPVGAPDGPRARLITQAQFYNSVGDIFGPDIDVNIRFAPVPRMEGLLAVGASHTGVSSSAAEQFHRSAYAVAAQVVDERHRGFLIPCSPRDARAADAACATKFLARTGRLLYRRSLSEKELSTVVAVAADAAVQSNDFYAGLSYALGGLLANPNFLFIVERAEPDPANPGAQRLTGESLATRLSLMLWNAGPDDALLKAAEDGSLHTPSGLAKRVEAMIASPRLEKGLRAFFADMFAFEAFTNLAKDPNFYPMFTQRTVDDSQEQLMRVLIDHTMKRDADYRDLFTSRVTYVTPDLAALYGVSAPASGWTRIELPADSPRVGLLGQVGLLAAYSHPGRSSPTKRGKALRELILCQKVPDPPPNVDFTGFEASQHVLKTARARIAEHSTNPVCAGCHKITDPIGLALENFDGAGQYRTVENGEQIDASGQLEQATFKDAAELGAIVGANPATSACMVSRVFSYATGRSSSPGDKDLMRWLSGRFADDGYRIKALLHAVATSDAFRAVRAPGEQKHVGN